MSKITHAELLATLNYNPETGMFTWRESKPWRKSDGSVGTVEPRGYWVVTIKDRTYKLHRLAWLYVYGDWPAGHIDHINQDRLDNRLSNLRIASQSDNSTNSKVYENNRLGVRGVRVLRGKYEARLQSKGKSFYLGTFTTLQEAIEARAKAAATIQGDFAPLA